MPEEPIAHDMTGEVPALDGVRGLLALWVLLGHTLIGVGGSIPVLNTPGLAVFGFMTLSGFLMAVHFRLREDREPWASPSTWRLFYTRRFFRIAPLYYTALAISFTFHHWFMSGYQQFPQFSSGLTQPLEVLDFNVSSLLLHVSFLFGFSPAQSNNNILPDWSLALEMQFYFLFPFLMLALRRIGPAWFAVSTWLIMSTAQIYSPTYGQPAFLPLVLSAFVIGIMISEAWLERDKFRASVLLVLAMFLSSVRMPAAYQMIPLVLTFLVIFPNLFAYLKVSAPGKLALKLLGGPLGSYIGDRSYSVYLLHMLVLVPLLLMLMRFPEFEQARPLVRFAFVGPIMVILCFAIAGLTFKYIETPFIALGRKLTARTRVGCPAKVRVPVISQ